jgi:3-oxoadipate enol-lactonase
MDHLGVNRAALIGCSMGGQIATDFTLEHPDRVSALVPVAAGLSGYEPDEATQAEWKPAEDRLIRAIEAGDMTAATDVLMEIWAPLGTDDPAGRRIREISLENPWAITEEGGESERGIDPPAAGRLKEISVPTLVVLGAQDIALINDNWKQRINEIPGARLEIIDDADHVVAMRQPERFNELVMEFLEKAA